MTDLSAEQRTALGVFQESRVSASVENRASLAKVRPRSDLDGVYVFMGSAGYVGHLDSLAKKLVPQSHIEGKLQVELSTIDQVAFRGFELRGYIPEGPTRSGPWSWVSRVFSSADGSLMSLSERNFAADGAGLVVYPELSNIDVNGSPGELLLHVSPPHKELWVLTWATVKKRHELYLAPSVGFVDAKERIVRMARSLR